MTNLQLIATRNEFRTIPYVNIQQKQSDICLTIVRQEAIYLIVSP